MSGTDNSLKSIAIEFFRYASTLSKEDLRISSLGNQDPILLGAIHSYPRLLETHLWKDKFREALYKDSVIQSLYLQRESIRICTPFFSGPIDLDTLAIYIFTSAYLNLYFFSIPYDESNFASAVLNNFETLKLSITNGKIPCITIHGIAGLGVNKGTTITTPWGTIYPAPEVDSAFYSPLDYSPVTNSFFIQEIEIMIGINQELDPSSNYTSINAEVSKALLLPLVCALASDPAGKPVAPLMTWTTYLFPIQFGIGFNHTLFNNPFANTEAVKIDAMKIAEWANIVDHEYTPNIDIAVKRLISAIAHRSDLSDALIDAVTTWESLVGTESEVSFRVTSALAKMVEPDPSLRADLVKKLKDIYRARCKIVHGDQVNTEKINEYSSQAIAFALIAMRKCFEKGKSWLELKSEDRSNKIILEWS